MSIIKALIVEDVPVGDIKVSDEEVNEKDYIIIMTTMVKPIKSDHYVITGKLLQQRVEFVKVNNLEGE